MVVSFPDGNSALMLCSARLRHVVGINKYLDMVRLYELGREREEAKDVLLDGPVELLLEHVAVSRCAC